MPPSAPDPVDDDVLTALRARLRTDLTTAMKARAEADVIERCSTHGDRAPTG